MTNPPQPGPYEPPHGGPQPQQGAYPGGGRQYGDPGQYQQGQSGPAGGIGGGSGGTQQFAQPSAYGQQPGSYGQQPVGYDPYGHQWGITGGEPPRRTKTGLIIAIAIAAVAVIGGGITLLVINSGDGNDQVQGLTTSQSQMPPKSSSATSTSRTPTTTSTAPSSSSSSPSHVPGSGPAPGGRENVQELAAGVINAYNSGAGKTVADSVCRSINTTSEVNVKPGLRIQSTGSVKESGNTAKVPITATVDGKTESGYLGFKKESDLWCFSGPSRT